MQVRKLLAVAALAGSAFAAQPAFAEDITLQFVVWNYSLDTVQDNVAKFEAANPGIKVKVTDYTWPDYQDSLTLRFRANTQTDVIYGGRPAVAEEVEILAELIPIAKKSYLQYKSSTDRLGIKKVDSKRSGYTVDTPVPYLLQDLLMSFVLGHV